MLSLEGVEDGLEAARGEEVQDGALERVTAEVRPDEMAAEAAHDAHEAVDVAAVDLRLGEVHEAGELAGGGACGGVEARAWRGARRWRGRRRAGARPCAARRGWRSCVTENVTRECDERM